MTAGSLEEYSIETGSLAQRDEILAIWRQCLSNPLAERRFEWFYRQAPWGPPMVQFLRHRPSGELVGTATLGIRRMEWHGAEIRAGQMVDLAVVPQHRSFGPARTLLRTLVEQGLKELDLIYGTPNRKAAGLVSRVTPVRMGHIVRHVCVLRHRRYLARHLPAPLAGLGGTPLDAARRVRRSWRMRGTNLAWRWASQAEPAFDVLWQRSQHGRALVQVHDAAFARWRFDASPFAEYRYLLLEENGELRAWFACREDAGTLHVDDWWAVHAAHGVDSRLVEVLLSAADKDGCEAVSFAFAGADKALAPWVRAGFAERQRRPIFGILASSREAPDHIHLTVGDEDE